MSATNFIADFIGGLARDDFYNGQTFPGYFDRDPSARSGDEANIVDDKISRLLLVALGFSDAERGYNPVKDHRRVDFETRISLYPRPCFVIEDKNTTINNLEKEALAQLEGYMRSHGAPRGLLCNGKQILAYELRDPIPALIADFDVLYLVQCWRGESLMVQQKSGFDALDQKDVAALRAFYNRFSRESYAGVGTLVRELTHTAAGKPHALDGSTFKPAFASDNPKFLERLIENTREVIQEIEFDVQAQLELRLREFEDYQNALELLPTRPNKPVRELIIDAQNALRSEFTKAKIDSHWLKTQAFLDAQLERFTERDITGTLEREILKHLRQAALQTQQEQNTKRKNKDAPIETVSAIFEHDALKPVQASLLEEPIVVSAKKIINALPTGFRTGLVQLQSLISGFHDHREALMLKYRDALDVREAYSAWVAKVAQIILKTNDEQRLHREFSAQTAYVLVVRMLLVRILEDKGLIPRTFTNGGVAMWFETIEPHYLKFAQGRSTHFLLEMAYTGAQHIYRHFYSERLLYDWYTPDRNLVVRILHRFAQFDLAHIDQDVIGHLYSRYVEDQHKHESGMYYTPPIVVDYILDRVGYQGIDAIENKRILDPACGSGTFLVKAANRIVNAYKTYHNGKIPPSVVPSVLETVQQGVYGMDLNPFACYLAETNLLIQVLDPIKTALEANPPVEIHLGRFKIFNTDTLKPEVNAAAMAHGNLELDYSNIPEAERIKLALNEHFDYVVANPPYVRADEGGEGLKEYRRQIKEEHPLEMLREACVKKWDLFVPFIALGWQLLKPNGVMGMITSNAIETVPYTESIRELLTAKTTVKELAFFPGVKLFEDAVVENTAFFVQNTVPTDKTVTQRRWFGQPDAETDRLEAKLIREETSSQTSIGVQVWRQSEAQQKLEGMVRLEEICYISVGMVLNAHEIKFPNEFKKDELISSLKDATHPVSYVEGKDIEEYELKRIQYLEYGDGLRAPEKIRRSTFPELYNRCKIVRGRTSAAFIDDGKLFSDWIYTNHSGIIAIRWIDLKGINNNSLRDFKETRSQHEKSSLQFNLAFLLGILNASSTIPRLFGKSTSVIAGEIEPEAIKALQIPDISLSKQQPIIALVEQLNALGLEFFNLRRSGWTVKTNDKKCNAPAIIPTGILKTPIGRAKISWGFHIIDPDATVSDARVKGDTLIRGKGNVIIEFAPNTSEHAKDWLVQQFKAYGDETLATLEARNLEIPTTIAAAEAALSALEGQEQEVILKLEHFHKLRAEVDQLVEKLYQPKPGKP